MCSSREIISSMEVQKSVGIEDNQSTTGRAYLGLDNRRVHLLIFLEIRNDYEDSVLL